MKLFNFVVILLFLSLVTSSFLGCSSLSKTKEGEWSGRMTPRSEQLEATRYQYQSVDLFFNQEGLVRERTENADFVVLTRYIEYDKDKDRWQAVSMTSQKEGPVELNDLGFPEKNERIEYTLDSRGRVYKAGKHEPQSLFFIPAFPYPMKSVAPKTSWDYEHDWITKKGLPMKLKVKATLLDKETCYKSKGTCWKVDLKGEVVPPAELGQKNFKSIFKGQCWIDENTGFVVQSWTSSYESIQSDADKIEVSSCLASQSQDGDFPTCPSDTPK